MRNRLARTWLAVAAVTLLSAGLASPALAQGATVISGRVLSSAGAPIEGAAITIPTTRFGTFSKTDGSFVLTANEALTGPQQIVVRRIGFKMETKTVTIEAGAARVEFVLSAQATQLVGVTVTALGILAEKTTIGTSQQTLTAEELTRTQTPSIISSLSGKVSGVQINQTGNMGGSSRIVIRGAGSILGENQPLFIIDGIPISNADFSSASAGGGRDYGSAAADINPDDIASLTVLKGPNAAALYGSRAANGAVIITTKTGRGSAEGTRMTFTSRMTSDQPSVLPTYQNRYGQGFVGEFQYVDGAGSGVNDGADESWGPRFDGQLIDQFHGLAQPWVAAPNNVSGYFRGGSTVSNNISVTTSARGMGARLSITKENTAGIVPFSSLTKLSGSLGASAVVNNRLTVNGTLQFAQTGGMNRPENGYTEGNPLMSFTWFGRQVDTRLLRNQYRNSGSPYGFADGSLYNWNDNYHRNPFWQQEENRAPDSRDRVFTQLSATYEFNSWLTGLVRAGSDGYRQTTEERFAAGNIDRANPSFNGGFNVGNSRAKETNFEGILTARRSWASPIGGLDFVVNAAGNIRNNDQFNSGYSTSGILVPGIFNLANAGIAPTFTNAEFHSAVNSAYGSASATLNRYWTVEVTGRNDWSSTLPKENASYFYPSINSSLVLSELFPALTQNGILSYLKVRGGIARVGSDAGPYLLQTLYNGSSNKFGGLPLYSLSNRSANAALKPEQTTSQEVGVEFSILDERITFDATYFLKETRNQIIPLTIAPATGFSATTINAGQISNRGVELMLTARPLRLSNGFTWTTSVNFSDITSRVDELAPGLSTITIASQWGANIEARQGQPYGTIFGYDFKRDPATGQRLLADGMYQRADTKSVLGNVIPDWTGGWLNEFKYREFGLSVLLDVQHGGDNFSIGNWWGTYAGVLSGTLKGREVDWDNPGVVARGIDEATGLANAVSVTAEDLNHSVYPIHASAVYSTGFVKLREVRLNYAVPTSFATRINLREMNVALVGRNLFTWTSFPNFDPENSSNATNGGKGFDMGAMPTTRSIGLNVTITP